MFRKIPFPRDRRQRQILFGAYILFVTAVLLYPTDTTTLTITHIDKVGHFLAFVLMAILALVSYERRERQVAAVFLTFVIAILLEWTQRFVPGRMVSVTDGLTNIIGLLTGIFIFWLYGRRIL